MKLQRVATEAIQPHRDAAVAVGIGDSHRTPATGPNAIANDDAAPRVLLHIGYHKTGSSWLRKALFNRPGSGFHSMSRDLPISAFVSPTQFKFCAQAAQAACQADCRDAAAQSAILVVSNERLSGYPASGGFDSVVIADRLHQTWPDAHVLIVLREQKDMIKSAYKQTILDGSSQSLRRFLQPPEAPRYKVPQFDLGFYEYHNLIAYYRQLFGAARCRVLLFENLRRDSRRFAREVLDFCGLMEDVPVATDKVHASHSPLSLSMRRLVNGYLTYNQLNNHGLLNTTRLPGTSRLMRALDDLCPEPLNRRMDDRLTKAITGLVGNYYAASNRETAKLIGEDLQAYGYEC